MIQANELRVGNLLEVLHPYTKEWSIEPVKGKTIRNFEENSEHPLIINNFKPIQLTEELLLRMGFEKATENAGNLICFKKSGKYTIAKWINNKWQFWINTVDLYNSPQYVHELQNLYYSLTKTELTLKPIY